MGGSNEKYDPEKTGILDDARALTNLPGGETRLVVMLGGGVQEFNLPSGGSPFAVGRSPTSHIHIDSTSVSRHHARIIPDAGGYLIQDLGSTNGTKINGAPIGPDPTPIGAGDTIRFGDIMAQLRVVRSSRIYAPRMVDSVKFDERVAEEAERCVRYGRSLSMIAVDVGAVGVKAGNMARSAIMSSLRSLDVIAVRGPGRFDLLLAECETGDAKEIAERVLAALKARDLRGRLGIASYPDDVGSVEGLLLAAQLAMHGVAEAGLAIAGHGARTLQIGDREVVIAEPSMVRLFGMIERMAAAPVPILVHGETGSGKEIVAEALHALGPRKAHELIKINCAALPEALLESELFGHEKGAFSGADTAKPGLFEAAAGGTLFLDEIGEMAPALQAKLLRVLEDKKVRRVGSVKERHVDVRFVAATHRDLRAAVDGGSFRQDLYFRLSGMVLELPPLRERPRELPLLTQRFAAEAAEAAGIHEPIAISPEATSALHRYDWPGNIRELRNTLATAVMLAMGGQLTLEHLPPHIAAMAAAKVEELGSEPQDAGTTSTHLPLPDSGLSLEEELRALERQRIEEALRECGGNQTKAAEYLGMPRRTLVRKLSALEIDATRRPR